VALGANRSTSPAPSSPTGRRAAAEPRRPRGTLLRDDAARAGGCAYGSGDRVGREAAYRCRLGTGRREVARRTGGDRRQMFRLDEELSGFYAVVSADGDLSWCATGAGPMLRAPTVFEDVVKTICTLIQPYTTNRAYEDLVRTHSRKASNRVALHSVRWPSSRRSGSSCGRWSPTT
jgi:hypothetical protein